MKVLFVCSGNAKSGISPIVSTQGESLRKKAIELEYYPVKGHGFSGYLRSAVKLHRHLKENRYDVLHAHYALSGWVCVFADSQTPIVISLMGDDAYGTYDEKGHVRPMSYLLIIGAKLLQPLVAAIIVKAENIYRTVWRKRIAEIIPNGVDLDLFNEMDKYKAREILNLPKEKILVTFLGNPSEPRKNIDLASKALAYAGMSDALYVPFPVEHERVPVILAATDIMLSTSTAEGSSNLIKEAMSCGCPIVATDTGDASWVLAGTEGCFITRFDPEEVAEKIRLALKFAMVHGRTRGRERIKELGLDLEATADKIIAVYAKVTGECAESAE